MENAVIIIFGPTGVGKTKTAVELAKKLNGEIISCDSMQVFQKMDIGTAKVSEEEKQGVPHHLLDVVSPFEEFSVGKYVELATQKIDEIFKRGKQPIIAGGTGLYINALINNYDFGNAEKDEEIREKYKKILEKNGNEFLFNILKEKNPEIAKKIHQNDTKKIIRALEKIENKNQEKKELKNNYKYLIFGLSLLREQIYENINLRAKKMFDCGLEEEVDSLLNLGLTLENQSMQGIGYKEIIQGRELGMGKEEILELVQRKTRNYAKRQLTFMRGINSLVWVDAKNATNEILEKINGKQN